MSRFIINKPIAGGALRVVLLVLLPVTLVISALAISVSPVAAGVVGPVSRPTPSAATEPVSLASGHTVTQTPAQIVKFWTKERLAKARPFPLPKGSTTTTVGSAGSSVSTGPSLRIPGSQPNGRGLSRPASAAVPVAGNPSPWWNSAWGRWPMVGRLYSYNAVYGWIGWCTATVVPSQNQSTIWTAGHCVVSGGTWHQYLYFVPGQNGPNDEPYGRWTIRYIDASTTWKANNDCELRAVACPWGADYGVAVADTVGGTTLTRTVGSIGIWFGKGVTGLGVRSLGYPSSEPYFTQYGGYLFYCDSAPSSYTLDAMRYYYATKPCGMNGGASGGPWLLAYGNKWYLVSNNSSADTADAYRNPQIPTIMNGPFLDNTTAKAFYNFVQAK